MSKQGQTEALEAKVAKAICRAYCRLHKRDAGWDMLTAAEQDAEVEHQHDLWLTEARAVLALPELTSLRASQAALVDGLNSAVRAANLALFVIRKQGVMPNDSWKSGFEKDMKVAEAALAQSQERTSEGENRG